jgi:imidazolonepropionase-like amidohydrolase
MRKLLAGACALALTGSLTGVAIAETVFVQAGKLLADPATGKVETAKTVVIENGKVTRIVDGYVAEPGGKVVDLKDSFVLPGLIDSHVHLTGEQGPNSQLDEVTQSSADQAMVGAGYARKTLMAGFTTVADLGAENDAIFALRDGIKRGDVIGPRIIAAGSAVSVHGGHGDVNGYSEEVMHVLRPTSVCSGADDCRRAVREQVWLGADIIKITATGGVLSNTAAGLNQQFSDAELQAIVETAHRMGRKVTAHAHGVDGINSFLKAGGDSIEHGTYLDADSIALQEERRLSGADPDGRRLRLSDRLGAQQLPDPGPDRQGPGRRSQDAGHGPPRPRRRGQDRLRHRHRRLGPRRQRRRVRAAGQGGPDAAGGHPDRDGQRRRPLQPLGRDRLAGARQGGGPDRGEGRSAERRDRAAACDVGGEGRRGGEVAE